MLTFDRIAYQGMQMGTGNMIYFVLLALLVIDLLFYGYGTAIQLVSRKDIEKKYSEGSKKSVQLFSMMERPALFVDTLQMVTVTINFLAGIFYVDFVGERIRNAFPPKFVLADASEVFATLVLLYLFLTFGILVPKKIAARYPDFFVFTFSGLMRSVELILRPFTLLITCSANLAVRIFGVDPNRREDDVTEEEIISMVNEGHEQGVLEASEAQMITNIFEFGDKLARDIMTHRESIIGIDAQTTLEDVMRFILEEKNSRYPVFEDTIDNIVGVLYFKDAVRANVSQKNRTKSIRDIPGLVMEAHFIPETRNIDSLFRNMQSLKIHMVIVVDEYGQTAGIVAMEDILEEIVGSILDEYDEDEAHINKQEDDIYVMNGLTPLTEVEELLHIKFEFEEETFETLNGFLTASLGRIPNEEDDFETEYQGYRFRILSVKNRVIQSVRCTRIVEEKI